MITTASLPNVLDKPNLRYLAVKMPFSNLSRRNLLITTFKKIMYLPDRGCVRPLRHLYGYVTGAAAVGKSATRRRISQFLRPSQRTSDLVKMRIHDVTGCTAVRTTGCKV